MPCLCGVSHPNISQLLWGEGKLRDKLDALSGMHRSVVIGIFVLGGCFLIALMTILLTRGSSAAVLLLDYSYNSSLPYPFSIQNMMYLLFFAGLGDLYVRWHVAQRELAHVRQSYLPEDEQTVLQPHELGAIRERVAGRYDAENGFLPYLINLSILQFQTSRSVDQAVSILNSSLELIAHRVDLRYALARYIVWAIPTFGFIGTVVGIAASLGFITGGSMPLAKITGNLAVAFNTTIVALVLSAILVFIMQSVQKSEETAVNLAGHYCLQNLINRLFAGGPKA